MSVRFIRLQIKKNYRDGWYQGFVRCVGWHRARGYGAAVVYEDGYVEKTPVAKLVEHQNEVWHELN